MQFIVKNTLFQITAFICNTIFIFLQVKILTNFLSTEQFGEYLTLIVSSILISTFITFGLPTAILRFIAKYEALDDKKGISFIIFFSWFIVSLMSLLIIFLCWYFVHFFHFSYLFIFACIFISTKCLNLINFAIFNGLRKMEYSTLLEISEFGLNIILLYWAKETLSIFKVLIINIISSFSIFIISFMILYLQIKPQLFFSIKNYFKDIIPFWRNAFYLDILTKARGELDRIVIRKFLSASSVSLFHIQAKITERFKQIAAIPLLVVSPEITYRFEQKKGKLLKDDLGFFIKLQLMLGMFLTIIVLSLSYELILFISNKNYLSTQPLLIIMILSLPILSFTSPIITTLKAIGKIQVQLTYDIIWIISYFSSISVLLYFFKLKGVAFAQIVAAIIVLIYTLFIIRKRLIFFLAQIQIPKIILISCIILGFNLLLKKVLCFSNLITIILIGSITFGLFVIMCSKVLSEEDKKKLIFLIPDLRYKKFLQFFLRM